ncbi:MAG TPA: PLDc N-terminal domain-containing protein [Rhodoglobus sp.]|nr:PLDc N-terminal domain-containing protein [Rhodoglobus sp.]
MARLLVIVPFLALALDVFALVDLSMIDPRRVRATNKFVWALIIIVLPFLGAILWFTIGRERRESGGQRRQTVAPDDDPEFLRDLRSREDQAERIRRLEQELADLDDDPPPAKD